MMVAHAMLSVFLAPALVVPVPRFQIEKLEVLPGWITSGADDITADGAVVGHGQTAGFDFRATIWHDINVTELGTLGGEDSVAHGANDVGQVVGYADLPDGVFHPALWDEGLTRDLGTLGGGFGGHFARAVNNLGQVVGSSQTSSGSIHAFLWQDGDMEDLGVLPGASSSIALDINDQQRIVGGSQIIGLGHRAFLWTDGLMSELGTLDGDSNVANAINEAGDIVGTSTTGEVIGDDNVTHAVLWRDGVVNDLGTLGGFFGNAQDINELGRIVGSAASTDAPRHAFLWQDGVMFDLNDLIPPDSGWVLWYADAINDSGQIAVTGRFNDTWRAARLVPVPVGDLDWSGTVNGTDLIWLLLGWGSCPEPCTPRCVADIDGDCFVGIIDFLLLLTNWG